MVGAYVPCVAASRRRPPPRARQEFAAGVHRTAPAATTPALCPRGRFDTPRGRRRWRGGVGARSTEEYIRSLEEDRPPRPHDFFDDDEDDDELDDDELDNDGDGDGRIDALAEEIGEVPSHAVSALGASSSTVRAETQAALTRSSGRLQRAKRFTMRMLTVAGFLLMVAYFVLLKFFRWLWTTALPQLALWWREMREAWRQRQGGGGGGGGGGARVEQLSEELAGVKSSLLRLRDALGMPDDELLTAAAPPQPATPAGASAEQSSGRIVLLEGDRNSLRPLEGKLEERGWTPSNVLLMRAGAPMSTRKADDDTPYAVVQRPLPPSAAVDSFVDAVAHQHRLAADGVLLLLCDEHRLGDLIEWMTGEPRELTRGSAALLRPAHGDASLVRRFEHSQGEWRLVDCVEA